MAGEFASLASFEVEQGVGGALLVPFRGDSLPPAFDFGAQGFDLFVQFIHRIDVQVLARQSGEVGAACRPRLQIFKCHLGLPWPGAFQTPI